MKLYYNIESPETEIMSFEDWKRLFNESETETKIQWCEKRSACTLARVMCPENSMIDPIISSITTSIPEFTNSSLDLSVGYIERESHFDTYKRGRFHDIEFLGTINGRQAIIPVEAKVDESFGSVYLSDILSTKAKDGSHAVDRAFGLRNRLRISDSVTDKIRYQLTYYLTGSLSDAHCFGADLLVMPIIVFKTSEYDKEKGKENHHDFLEFLDATDFKKVAPSVYYKRIEDVDAYFVWREMNLDDRAYNNLIWDQSVAKEI